MIVKNESKIITRLFNSVLPIVDSYCICDTGSTDNTVELIKDYFEKHNINGKIIFEPFKNFCHNRNVALKSALGMSDYILLLDADMSLEIKDFNKKDLIQYDCLKVLQGNNDFYYQNVRIIKNNGLYYYIGVTHEYINTPSKIGELTKNQLFIHDIGDGGSKKDKFERDINLLLEGIKEEPNNVRYHFYLANSYYDSGDYEKAIKTYETRIILGGWEQEVWYSHYRIGLCYKKLDKMSNAVYSWLNGYHLLPERLEGIYEIINHYRIISKHKTAHMFYKIAIDILNKNYNKDSYLFLHNDIYSYKIFYEYTIFSAYIGNSNINDEVVTILNVCNNKTTVNNLFQNMKFYKDVLKHDKINLDNKKNILVNNENILFNSSSSCLLPTKNGYLLNVRYVNYNITETGSYTNCEKNIITANQYMTLRKDLTYESDKFFNTVYTNSLYIGIEDIRIFNDVETQQLLFIGTGLHSNNNIGVVSGEYNCHDPEVKTLVSRELKQTFENSKCEKNWVFVEYKKSTHIIYKWFPLQICKKDETNHINIVCSKNMPLIFSHVRGSSCGFKYTHNPNCLGKSEISEVSEVSEVSEIWFIVHLVSYESPRHYYHMLVVFDESLNLLRYSAPFKFEGESIEYSLSLIVEDDRVLINYSTWDRTTRIGVYDKKYIDSIIKYS
jgi:tetratricopeptide (TPR) repeat protein